MFGQLLDAAIQTDPLPEFGDSVTLTISDLTGPSGLLGGLSLCVTAETSSLPLEVARPHITAATYGRVHCQSRRNVDDEPNRGYIATAVLRRLYSNLTGLEFHLEVTV